MVVMGESDSLEQDKLTNSILYSITIKLIKGLRNLDYMSRGLEKTCKNEQQENLGKRLRKIRKFFLALNETVQKLYQ